MAQNTTADSDLHIWPNPATDEVWIDAHGGSGATYRIVLLDLMGRAVLTADPIADNGHGQLVLQLGSITQGTYVIQLFGNGRSWSRRIVKM